MALSVFSAVCVAAISSKGSETNGDATPEHWSLAVAIISLILSFAAVVAYIATGLRAMFVGQRPEQGLLLILTAFWAAGLPAMMNPKHEIATRNENAGITIINANLYFFAWLAFAAVLYLTGSWAQEYVGYDVTQTPPHTARWYGLTASSVVVMGAAVRGLKSSNCNIEGESDTEHCKRTKFAIACGVVGFVLAGIMTFLQHTQQTTKLWVETAFTTVLLTLWCCGVGFITFGDAPGSTISNLYFATWISFILAVFLFATNFRQVIAARYQAHSPSNNENGGGSGEGSGNADAEAPVGNNPTVMSGTGDEDQHDF